MQRYLLDHALRNVWCNPEQDNQVVIAAQRLTKNNGELNRFTLMNRQVSLPLSGKRFHVYQIGQILPVALGLKPLVGDWEPQQWIKFSDAMATQNIIANIYTTEGVNLPRFNSYYMFSNDRNLIFAVEIDTAISINYNTEQIYLRLYSNAFYQSIYGDSITDVIISNGRKISNVQNVLDLQAEVITHRAKTGWVSCYVNGLLVDNISPVTAIIGDSVEYVYDSSVKRVVTFDVNTLLTFNSELDSKYKYLLHHSNGNNDTIDYHDDIDIYITHTNPSGLKRGVYYHRNKRDAHRMVTHRDYAIAVDYYDSIATSFIPRVSNTTLDIRTFKLEVVIRNSGFNRPLVYDDNRIFELNKLTSVKRLQAMVGLDATLDKWKAEKLENSAYVKLMSVKVPALNMSLVQNAYGYNAISKIIGDSPIKTSLRSGSQIADLPLGLQENSTVYEYDSNGHMLGFHYHTVGSEYICVNSQARLVEVISGKGSHRPGIIFGTDNITLPVGVNYRVYMCFTNSTIHNNVWRDITGTNEYTVVNGVLIWNETQYDQFIMIRTDASFLAYDVNVDSTDGTLSLVITEEEDRGTGFANHNMPVPAGELDLFLNGKSLINGLDYIVKFPKIHILNKTHLIQPAGTANQIVHVRFTGFCNSQLQFDAPDDYGFIQHDYLSDNNRFDIRDDKVLRITVDGSVIHRDDILFSEEHDGISIVNPNNGKPYQIKDVVVPLQGLVDENTYSLRDKSIITDKQVSDYMTIKSPEASRGNLMTINSKYVVVSTFISRIINAIENLEIPTSVVNSNLSDNDVLTLCAPFEHLLRFDPINTDNGFDLKFVKIVPHRSNTVKTLTLQQYRLLTRIVKLYADGLIDLASFVNFNS